METFRQLVKKMTNEQIEELIQFSSQQHYRNKDILVILITEKGLRNEMHLKKDC